ncbi:hypothetical protein FQZ93_27705, partial [Escherichia coli]|nr:hypothetical protein [Escherichia coli]
WNTFRSSSAWRYSFRALAGEMSCRSGMSWNTLLAELTDGQSKRQALLGPPAEKVLWPPPPEAEKAPLPEPEPPTEPAAP